MHYGDLGGPTVMRAKGRKDLLHFSSSCFPSCDRDAVGFFDLQEEDCERCVYSIYG